MAENAFPQTSSPGFARPLQTPGLGRAIAAAALMGAALLAIGLATPGLSTDGRITLGVFVAALLAWSLLRLPDTSVALAAVLGLVAFGAIEEDALFETFEEDIVWLLIAAFILASVIRRTGLAQRCGLALLSRCGSVAGLFRWTTLFIAATAFAIPSTSGRAAVLLPLFLALAAAVKDARIVRGLGLLFPSVILLSACASLTGAGAHLIAVEMLDGIDAPEPDFASWALIVAPFGILTSVLACELIMALFLTKADRKRGIDRARLDAVEWGPTDRRVGAVMAAVVGLWAATPWHGLDLALVALAGAVVAASRFVSGVPLQAAVKDVEWNLLIFLAATLAIGAALIDTGAAAYLAQGVLRLVPGPILDEPVMVIAAAAFIATLSHLVIVSRTARVAVLVPAVALPLAALGHDPFTLVMTVTVGSGFCQTLPISAKPVMIFAASGDAPFDGRDLLRLSLWLAPVFVVLVIAFGAVVWPHAAGLIR